MDDGNTLMKFALPLLLIGVVGCLIFVGAMMIDDDDGQGSEYKYTLYMGLGPVSSEEACAVETVLIGKLTSDDVGFTEFRANGSSSGDGDTEKTLVFILGMSDRKTVDDFIGFAKENGVQTVLIEKQSADYEFA